MLQWLAVTRRYLDWDHSKHHCPAPGQHSYSHTRLHLSTSCPPTLATTLPLSTPSSSTLPPHPHPLLPSLCRHHNSGSEEGSFLAKHRSKSAGWYGGEKIHVFYSLPWAHLHTWNASPLRRTWNLICGLTQGSCKVSFHPPSFRGLSLTLKAGHRHRPDMRY